METKETKNLIKAVFQAILAMVCFIGAQSLLGIVYEMFLLKMLGDLQGEYLKVLYTIETLFLTLIAAFPIFCAVMRIRPKGLRLLFKQKKGGSDFKEYPQFLILSLGIASIPVLIQAFLIVNSQLDPSTLSVSSGMDFLLLTIQFIFVMPVVEEMMFRGFILNHFRHYGTTVILSILLYTFHSRKHELGSILQ